MPIQTDEHTTDLEGLHPTSWGGSVLQKKPLTLGDGGLIESCILYPVSEDRPPEEVFLIPLDFGKRALKGGGVTKFGDFMSTCMVDAYSTARYVQQEEADGKESDFIWKVTGPDKKPSETFRCGTRALRVAEALPVNETVAQRLKDPRVRNMIISFIIENLQAIGVDACVYEDSEPTIKKRNIILPIGLPADDINKRGKETGEALSTLKGCYTVDQYDTRTGLSTTWRIEIIGILPTPQPRGTHYTATKNLDGTAAFSKKIVTVIDIGGGDIYKYEVDSSSGTITDAKRLGDGTIDMVRGEGGLISLVEDHYGITISEAQAQEALYKKTILKGGEEQDISDIIEALQPRFANLLTKIAITGRLLSTFLVFTGGGVALLHDQIREKMQALPGKQIEGRDYLIMPVAIAPYANCIGLFAHGFYKAQQIIRNSVTQFLSLSQQQQSLLLKRRERHNGVLDTELATLQTRLEKHVGQHYKYLQQQILAESKQSTTGER